MDYALSRTEDAVEFGANRGKLIRYLAATAIITAFSFIPILKPMPTTRGIIGGMIVMIVFGLISIYLVINLLRSGRPALILTSQGFSYPKAIAETIAWDAVRDVKPLSTGRGQSLLVSLYPEAAEKVTPTGLLAWLRRSSRERRGRFVIPLQLLDDESNRIPQIFVRKVNALRALRSLDPDLGPVEFQAQPRAELAAPAAFPFVTAALGLLLVGIFVWEVRSSIDPLRPLLSVSPKMLAADGGLLGGAIQEAGQWWRLFTAPLLHGGLAHLISNGIALVLIGVLLERLVGHARFAAIFAASALAGSVLSLIVNPANIVGVGASGGIVGLFAAVFVVSFRVASETARKSIMRRAAYTAILVLIPSGGASGIHTDYAAHFGGAIGGAAAAFLLFRSWPQDRSSLRMLYGAAALAAAYFAIAAFAVIPIRQQHSFFALYKQLTPEWPTNFEEAKRRAPAALTEYPRDPRARFARAATLAESHDLSGAEKEMRAILADKEMLALPAFQVLERNVRFLMSGLLVDLRRRDEAQDIARPLCGRALPSTMQQRFDGLGLCEARV